MFEAARPDAASAEPTDVPVPAVAVIRAGRREVVGYAIASSCCASEHALDDGTDHRQTEIADRRVSVVVRRVRFELTLEQRPAAWIRPRTVRASAGELVRALDHLRERLRILRARCPSEYSAICTTNSG